MNLYIAPKLVEKHRTRHAAAGTHEQFESDLAVAVEVKPNGKLLIRDQHGDEFRRMLSLPPLTAEQREKLTRLHQTHSPASPRQPLPQPAFIAERRAICEKCEHRRGEKCGAIENQDKAWLMGSQGIPNPKARCRLPEPKWEAVTT